MHGALDTDPAAYRVMRVHAVGGFVQPDRMARVAKKPGMYRAVMRHLDEVGEGEVGDCWPPICPVSE
jgi:hypothetical protein